MRGCFFPACCFFLTAYGMVKAETYFVAPDGDDSASGSIDSPFATWSKGQGMATAGDTVFFRSGTYFFRSESDTVGITLDKSGNPEKRIQYWAYEKEKPIFDFAGLKAPFRITGISVTATHLHLKGLEMRGVMQTDSPSNGESVCIRIDGGSSNIFEGLNIHHNMGTGFHLANGMLNLVLNCDSHNNYDPYSYVEGKKKPGINADGFAAHVSSSNVSSNKFRGCRAWSNSDAGFEIHNSFTSVEIDTCWAWSNGFRPETDSAGGRGDGFKMGGYDKAVRARLDFYCACIPRNSVRRSIAFWNRGNGFNEGGSMNSNVYYHNTGFRNGQSNFNGSGWNGNNSIGSGLFRNNISHDASISYQGIEVGSLDFQNNSWSLDGIKVDSFDFQSLDTTGISGPRRSDGGLPELRFLKLAPGSDLIDQGVVLNFPKYNYFGSAPDLGAFESEPPTGVHVFVPQKKALNPKGGKLWDASIDATGRRKLDNPDWIRSHLGK